MIRKPEEIKEKTGTYFRMQFAATAITTIISTWKESREAGTISAMNMPYKAIPMAFWRAAGSTEEMLPPRTVPRFQPMIGKRISPNIYGARRIPGFKEAITKVSSVIPKLKPIRAGSPVPFSSRCPRDRDMSMYRMLITKVVMATSIYPAPWRIRFVPAN